MNIKVTRRNLHQAQGDDLISCYSGRCWSCILEIYIYYHLLMDCLNLRKAQYRIIFLSKNKQTKNKLIKVLLVVMARPELSLGTGHLQSMPQEWQSIKWLEQLHCQRQCHASSLKKKKKAFWEGNVLSGIPSEGNSNECFPCGVECMLITDGNTSWHLSIQVLKNVTRFKGSHLPFQKLFRADLHTVNIQILSPSKTKNSCATASN